MIKIIGGGPCGLMAGFRLAKAGKKTTIYEEHKKIGSPVQCTGIVTDKIKNIIPIKKDFIINKIKRAKIISKNCSIELGVNDLIIDRMKFDSHIADLAQNNGAKIILNKKITKLPYSSKNIIIGADGPNSIVRKKINPNKKINYYIGKQAVVKGNFEKDMFEVFMGNIAKNFFAWIVPENESYARVGIAGLKNINKAFQKFIKLKKISAVKNYQAGLIPIYDPLIKTQYKNMYIVGDAAAQVKATTGGGLIPGLTASIKLAESIIKKKDYEKEWRRKIGKELFAHLTIRKILNKFNNKDYDQLIHILNKEKIKKQFNSINRDNGVKLATSLLLKEPKLLKYLWKLF